MDSDHLFNRDEISQILKRAAELEHKDNIEDESEGLTLQELQQVSNEVGLHPKYIQKAINQLEASEQSVGVNLIGGPFTYHYSSSVPAVISDEDWEEIVSEIRNIHGGIGKTNKLGNTFTWDHEEDVGYIQLSLSAKKNRTRINIHSNYNQYAFIVYLLSIAFSFLLLAPILAKGLDLTVISEIIIGVTGTASIMSVSRFYLSRWMQKKRKTYSTLIKRFKELLSSKSDGEETPTISIPSEDRYRIKEDNPMSDQSNKIRE